MRLTNGKPGLALLIEHCAGGNYLEPRLASTSWSRKLARLSARQTKSAIASLDRIKSSEDERSEASRRRAVAVRARHGVEQFGDCRREMLKSVRTSKDARHGQTPI